METLSVTAFLIRRDCIDQVRDFLRDQPDQIPLSSNVAIGTFFPISSEPDPPNWAKELQEKLLTRPPAHPLNSQSPAGIMSLWLKGRLILITFGHAWMKLDARWYQHDFGRRAALNLIDEDALRQIRLEQVLAKRHRQIERSPGTANLYSFGYESDRDLVFSVEGVSRNKLIHGTVRGGAALRFETKTELLPKALELACKRQGYGYQKKFPDIDSLSPITNQLDIQLLDAQLDAELKSPHPRISMAPPASLEVFDQDLYFTYGRWNPKNHARSWNLSFDEWRASLGGVQPTLEASMGTAISVVDASTNIRRARIYPKDCFSFDVTNKKGHFVLFSGKWYMASPNLEAKIEHFLNSLLAPTAPPPRWNGIDDETAYNNSVCNLDAELVHMDARNVMYGGGQSRFEFCDFLNPVKRILYFAKSPSSAQGMSHLFEQTRRTVELFFGNNDMYLTKLRQKLRDQHPQMNMDWIEEKPTSSQWEVCLVSLGKRADQLSMFPKCGLMKLHREVSGRCGKVTFAAL